MRFVPIKFVEQQAVLSLHRIRSAVVAERTAQINQIRGLMSEFGLIMPTGRYWLFALVFQNTTWLVCAHPSAQPELNKTA